MEIHKKTFRFIPSVAECAITSFYLPSWFLSYHYQSILSLSCSIQNVILCHDELLIASQTSADFTSTYNKPTSDDGLALYKEQTDTVLKFMRESPVVIASLTSLPHVLYRRNLVFFFLLLCVFFDFTFCPVRDPTFRTCLIQHGCFV